MKMSIQKKCFKIILISGRPQVIQESESVSILLGG